MSQTSADLVLAAVDAYNAGDFEAWEKCIAPDVQTFPASVFREAGPLHGRDAYRAWTEEIGSAWISPRWEVTDVLAAGTDLVLCRGDWGGEGVASGIKTYASITGVFTVRADRVTRAEFYFDHAEALKAAGLEE